MSHYEERLEKDLARIRERLQEVSAEIELAVERAVHAILTVDRAAASATILGDLRVNREIRAIDHLCHAFVARHLPSAGHLRFVSSVLRLDVELERIGDYAVTISREAVQISTEPPATVKRDIEMLADQARRVFRQAMKAFLAGNAELARGTAGMASQARATYDKIFADLIREGEIGSRGTKDLFALLVVFNRLDRISDQSKNICEETLFAVTGETKAEKVYDILFVDERNDCLSQIAEAFARRAYPGSGRYASAGWNPAEELQPGVVEFMERHGSDLRGARPKPLSTEHADLSEQNVIVGLEGELRQHIEEVPFHTVLLEWDAAPLRGVGPPDDAWLEEAYKWIAHEVRMLMELLRGEEAP